MNNALRVPRVLRPANAQDARPELLNDAQLVRRGSSEALRTISTATYVRFKTIATTNAQLAVGGGGGPPPRR